MNLLPKRFVMVMLAATSVLWLARCLLQGFYPQGSFYLGLQYAMLAAFMIVFLSYFIPLILLWSKSGAIFECVPYN